MAATAQVGVGVAQALACKRRGTSPPVNGDVASEGRTVLCLIVECVRWLSVATHVPALTVTERYGRPL